MMNLHMSRGGGEKNGYGFTPYKVDYQTKHGVTRSKNKEEQYTEMIKKGQKMKDIYLLDNQSSLDQIQQNIDC